MNDIKAITKLIEKEIKERLSEKRYRHSRNVAEESIKLTEKYGGDKDKAILTGLAHDIFRDLDDDDLNRLIVKYDIGDKYLNNNALAHGPLAAEYLEDKYDIVDEDILDSVRYHTTGRKYMGLLERIVFLADSIEKDRVFPGVENIRRESKRGLNYGVMESLRVTVNYLRKKGAHIDQNTMDAVKYIDGYIEFEKE